MLLELKKCISHRLICAVTSQIYVKNVFPVPLLGWAGFNLAHVHIEFVEGLQCFDK